MHIFVFRNDSDLSILSYSLRRRLWHGMIRLPGLHPGWNVFCILHMSCQCMEKFGFSFFRCCKILLKFFIFICRCHSCPCFYNQDNQLLSIMVSREAWMSGNQVFHFSKGKGCKRFHTLTYIGGGDGGPLKQFENIKVVILW